MGQNKELRRERESWELKGHSSFAVSPKGERPRIAFGCGWEWGSRKLMVPMMQVRGSDFGQAVLSRQAGGWRSRAQEWVGP